MSNKRNQLKIIVWLEMLHDPQMNQQHFQEIRNKYLMMICLSLLIEKFIGIFISSPPEELYEIEEFPIPVAKYKWEEDSLWTEITEQFNEITELQDNKCLVHIQGDCPKMNETSSIFGDVLDNQFQLYLYMAKPHVVLLKNRHEKLLSSQWIQTLCCINKKSCTASKAIRNDYMMALGGYLTTEHLAGPFLKFPPVPLTTIADISKNDVPITDTANSRVEEFLKDLPKPEEGAFAVISLTGDLYDAFQ